MTLKPSRISGLIILVLAGMTGYQMVYLRTQQQLVVLNQELARAGQTQALRAQVAASLSELERFRKQLPSEPETGWLIRAVGSRAQETGIQLTTIMPQSPKLLQDFTYLAVNLQFTASYRDLMKLLHRLEQAHAFIRIDEIELSRTPQEIAQVRLVVSTLHVPALIEIATPEPSLRVPAPNAPQPKSVAGAEGRVQP